MLELDTLPAQRALLTLFAPRASHPSVSILREQAKEPPKKKKKEKEGKVIVKDSEC